MQVSKRREPPAPGIACSSARVGSLTPLAVRLLFRPYSWAIKGESGSHTARFCRIPADPVSEPARPELDKALAYLRAGDVFVITRLSRAMRSLKHLLALADELRDRGVGLVVLKQQIDTTTPQGRLVFHLLGAIDESSGS